MNLSRTSVAAVSVAAASALILGACSSNSDKNSATSSQASKVENIACAGKQNLKSSGSTAQANAMQVFMKSYAKSCPGSQLAYAGGGSGQGVSDFTKGLTDFGGSDSPLTDAQAAEARSRCKGSDAWNLPLVFGPIAVAYNLPGVDGVALSGPTLAKIFDGQISEWNDPAIAAENPGKQLPAKKIDVLYRAEESGTTDNFQKYLTAAGGWTKGTGKKFNGGVGEGKQGNPGVGTAVQSTPYSIGYVEWSFAKQKNLQQANIITGQDRSGVQLTSDSVSKTIGTAKLKNGDASNNLVIDTSSFYNPTAPGAYPIVLATYELVCSNYGDTPTSGAVKTFLKVASSPQNQGADLQNQGYAPLPDSFRARLDTAIDAIQ
ncbi:phosphate ABC transporter substrate-binding protein PstS [Jongsikchunia kroppenstedtii]|uniref:phosphate ABC transporter substrate-binding protein PstS n=1 Tax=Jongsikchunia kroppenstedtii TaxID=1121721 RepID=UPI0003A7E5A1|nr:phosphate ABC transporter substrate-binding protein PstS [Jongsikchunia kroppenstedtii]